jgi:VanZ family protein
MARWLLSIVDRVARWPALVAWLALIFGLSSIPNEIEGPTSGVPYDKVAHVIEFGVLAFLLAWVIARWRGDAAVMAGVAAVSVAAALAYGVSDELHQAFVPGRDPSWADLATDAAGAIVGAVAAMALSRMRSRRETAG